MTKSAISPPPKAKVITISSSIYHFLYYSYPKTKHTQFYFQLSLNTVNRRQTEKLSLDAKMTKFAINGRLVHESLSYPVIHVRSNLCLRLGGVGLRAFHHSIVLSAKDQSKEASILPLRWRCAAETYRLRVASLLFHGRKGR